jgi:hypothetical protein
MQYSVTEEQSSGCRHGEEMSYRLFGISLTSDFSFSNRLLESAGETTDLTFSLVRKPPTEGETGCGVPAYVSPHQTPDGESRYHLYRYSSCDLLRFTRVASFTLWPRRILCHLPNPADAPLMEINLLGPVLSFWLERSGTPVLHAAAIVVEDRAVALLAPSTAGKSSLAMTLLQHGCPLLTDDILPLVCRRDTVTALPGYPQVRLWPDQVERFVGHYQDLEQVHPAFSKRRVPIGTDGIGAFCDLPRPLACFYLPERRVSEPGSADTEITPLSTGSALIELVKHSFIGRMVEAIGWQPQRLPLLTSIARQVPMRRISYPSGFEHLPRIREAILQDLRTIS